MTTEPTFDHPEVIFDVVFEKGIFSFSWKNITHLPAFKPRVAFEKPMKGADGKVDMGKMKIFRELEYLAPYKEIVVFLDVANLYFAREKPTEPKKFVALLKWMDSNNKVYHRKITHNLNAYKDFGYINIIE